ncbi:hypothetical protein KAR91_07320 [Candidatus Pacearchaeota archaeon]|nr:hypothetical protein [Candidatus Pacearchaeota archaeon]
MGLNFGNSWPERDSKQVSNKTLGEHLKKTWGKNAGKRFEDVVHALSLLEEMGDITQDEASLILHGGSMENSQFLENIDEVVRHNKGYDKDKMSMEGLSDGVRSIVNRTRLDWYDDNGLDSNSSHEDMEKILTRQGTARARELKKDEVFSLEVKDEPDADVNRDEITGAPQLTFDSMDDEE